MSQEINTEEKVRRLTEPTKENAIRDMFFSKILFLTKNNKFLSFVVNEYMDEKKKYLPYIIEEKRERFITDYSAVFQHVQSPDDDDVYYELLNWEHACEIMEMLNENTDWESVDQMIKEHRHSGYTMGRMAGKIEFFSPYGCDFIRHVYHH